MYRVVAGATLFVVVVLVGVAGWLSARSALETKACTTEDILLVDGRPVTYEDALAMGKSEFCAAAWPPRSYYSPVSSGYHVGLRQADASEVAKEMSRERR